MSVELMIWLGLSLIGVATLPFVSRRRHRETMYHRMLSGNGVRAVILRNRATRATLLSVGVLLAASVPVAVAVLPETDQRRVLTIVLLIGVLATMVATLITDEWFSDRIDKAEKFKRAME